MLQKIFRSVADYLRLTDKLLWSFCIGLSALSVLLLYSQYHFGFITLRVVLVQAIASVLGIACAAVLSQVDYHLGDSLWKWHVALCAALIAATFVLGVQNSGADDKAWLMLPFGLYFQPSELAKLSFIFTFAKHLQAVGDNINQYKNLALLALHGAVPVLVIHFQGDDGTALCFAVIFLFMLFSAGLSWRFIAAGVGAVVVAVPVLWNFVLSDMQKRRFLILFNPELDPLGDAFQQIQSKNAIGSGGVFGLGLFGETPVEVPYMRNDFIFAYIGQTLGFVGGTMVVLALLFVALKMLLNGLRSVDKYGYFICVGVFAIFFFQIFINIGMCLGFMPVIGLTLPFLSAGGTSVVMLYLSVGIVQSVFMHGRRDLFS